MVFFGEIGLSGELRLVAQTELRLKEAAKLGFYSAGVPRGAPNRNSRPPPEGITLTEFGHLKDLIVAMVSDGTGKEG